MFGLKKAVTETVAEVKQEISAEESQKTLQQVKEEGMSSTNLKKLAESLNQTSSDVHTRLAAIAESLRGKKPLTAKKTAPEQGGFYGPLQMASIHLVSTTELLDEIEVVLGIKDGSQGVRIPAANLNG